MEVVKWSSYIPVRFLVVLDFHFVLMVIFCGGIKINSNTNQAVLAP
jgi:hypothetical protein